MSGGASAPDLILHSGLFTTLDRSTPTATAVAIEDGVFTSVGRDHDVMQLAGSDTWVINLKGKRGALGRACWAV